MTAAQQAQIRSMLLKFQQREMVGDQWDVVIGDEIAARRVLVLHLSPKVVTFVEMKDGVEMPKQRLLRRSVEFVELVARPDLGASQ
jgi:hypothetical protein